MAAEQGDPDAAYTLSLEASDPVERFRLLLIAAERGYTAAQEEAARAYYTGIGAPQNYVHAYAWALLAQARTGDISFTSGLEEQMTKTQIVEAQQLAENLRVQIESNKKDVCQKFGNKYANKGVSCP
ncbi:MAG: hypothetical protein PHE68_02930 [Candidatus Peribacteraceae bacterium]|nr:hypothetical protein [Candidatus Peribacteraceae bacterium]MDD5074813.1 hypothetical protein [Candidatus Peribacteraceae bacterium]